MIYGYVYLRENEYWNMYDAVKLGKTSNIPDRERTYITSEIKKGKFIMVIEIDLEIMDLLEKDLQKYFNSLGLNIKFNAGVEFYNKKIIDLIIPFLDKINIKYKILTENEINNLIGKIRINNKSIENKYVPRDYQKIIIDKTIKHFKNNEKGILIIPCGVGKTLISLWSAEKLNSDTILIGVPNKLLLEQWKEIICIIFPNIPYLKVSGSIDIESIKTFLKNNKKCIVITTYSSSYKVYTETKKINYIFDIKINDETHHLTSSNIIKEENKTFINMLKIKSKKQLSLTATLKLLENKENIREEDIIISNDNIEYFGEIIERKSLLWAINKNIVCDYVIQTIITNEEQLEQQLIKFNIVEENDKRLFLSSYATLKSIFEGHSHHLLIYSNNKENSLKLINYITILIKNNYFNIQELYYNNYHSEIKSKEQKEIIKNFKKSKYGIISCVYCLGEGHDDPNIDGVVFSENMSSNIRIVQSSLRASRKNKLEPKKITKIILPILNKEEWLKNENSDFKKVREVIYQMGLEDETIEQKIKVLKIDITKSTKTMDKNNKTINNFGEYDEELTKQLKLKTVNRMSLSITYEKARKIILEKNINSKKEYYELCEKDNRLSENPEEIFKGQFTNWIEYLSIKRVFYDLETCKNKVSKYLFLNPNIKQNHLNISIIKNELCKEDNLFPPEDLWIDYYEVKDLRDIIIINNKKKSNIIF
jgi:predicted helicase